MSKKIISIFLSLVIFVVWVGNVSAVAEEGTIQEIEVSIVENPYNKLHFYFNNEEHTIIDSSSELQEAVNCIVQNTNVKTRSGTQNDSEITVTVEFASDFINTPAYKDFAKERESIDSIEDLRDFRHRLNEYSKAYHNDLISKNLSSVDLLDYEECEAIGYSPFVTLTMDVYDVSVDALQELCEMSNVKNISLRDEAYAEDEASWNQALDAINAYDIVNNSTYTGKGIRIGVYEANGVCDTSHINLSDKDITIRDASVGISSHATEVTSILAIMAPDAEFYISKVYSANEGIAWFIEKECDIVNCSFGYYNNDLNADNRTYTDGIKTYEYSIDGLYDYQISVHFITVVTSSGNKNTDNTSLSYNPENRVCSPGYGYNVITVGGVKREYNNSQYRWVWASDASYLCSSPVTKPTVSAPYTINIPNIGIVDGTSYSTPLVAGSIALLMEADAGYCAYPERILALLVSTAQRNNGNEETIGYFDEKTGAGIIDLERMIDSDKFCVLYNDDPTAERWITGLGENLTAGTEVQIGLAWIAVYYSRDEQRDAHITNYDLKVLDSSGDTIFSSTLTDSNIELVRFTVPRDDRYQFWIYQTEAINPCVVEDWIALSYNYE